MAIKNDIKTLHDLLNSGAQLTGIQIEELEQKTITLNFILLSQDEVIVSFNNPLLFSFTRSSNDDGAYPIGEVRVTEIKNTDVAILKALNYGNFDSHGKPKLDVDDAAWMHVEGCIVLDIICTAFCIRKCSSH